MSSTRFVYTTYSKKQTKEIANKLGECISCNITICFSGNLGAGKTTFIQGLAQGLGIKENVTSPTFSFLERYTTGRIPLNHFDLYRIESANELEDIAFFEFVEDCGVSCIEWASLFRDELPDDRLEIALYKPQEASEHLVNLSHKSLKDKKYCEDECQNCRVICFKAYGKKANNVLDKFIRKLE